MFRAKFSTQNPEIAVHSLVRSAMFDISLPSLFCERLLKTRLDTSVCGGKKRQLLLFFLGLFLSALQALPSLLKETFFTY